MPKFIGEHIVKVRIDSNFSLSQVAENIGSIGFAESAR